MKSGFRCLKERNIKACQILANICVLQMYNLQLVPCQLYKFINDLQPAQRNKNLGAKENMPWLYYIGNSTEILNNTERVKFTPSFDPNDPLYVNKIDLYIAKYDYEGNYFGMKRLSNELNLCTNDNEKTKSFMQFGNSVSIKCNIDFYRYLRGNYTTYFYELFMFDQTTNEMIDIPIMIDNAKNEKEGWKRNNETNPSNWLLTRRFFMIDNIAGLEGQGSYFNNEALPKAIRYAHIVNFKVTLQSNRYDSKIFLPYVEIFYKTKRLVDVKEIPTSEVIFQSNYLMDISHLYRIFTIVFIVIIIIISINLLVNMYSWYQMNPPELSPDNHTLWMLTTFLFTLMKLWGFYIFWFTFSCLGYFYIFFKLQYQVFIFLFPTSKMVFWDIHRPHDVVWGIGCASYFIYLLYKIYDCSNDNFNYNSKYPYTVP
jgi:hypothetical protein